MSMIVIRFWGIGGRGRYGEVWRESLGPDGTVESVLLYRTPAYYDRVPAEADVNAWLRSAEFTDRATPHARTATGV